MGLAEKSDGWGAARRHAALEGTCVVVDLISGQHLRRGVPALSVAATPRNAKCCLVSQIPKDERKSVMTVIDYSILKQ